MISNFIKITKSGRKTAIRTLLFLFKFMIILLAKFSQKLKFFEGYLYFKYYNHNFKVYSTTQLYLQNKFKQASY